MEDKLEKEYQEKGRSGKRKHNCSSNNDDFTTSRLHEAFSDSLHLFEEFFFGASTGNGEYMDDFFDGIFGNQRKQHQQQTKDSDYSRTGRQYHAYEDFINIIILEAINHHIDLTTDIEVNEEDR